MAATPGVFFQHPDSSAGLRRTEASFRTSTPSMPRYITPGGGDRRDADLRNEPENDLFLLQCLARISSIGSVPCHLLQKDRSVQLPLFKPRGTWR